MPQDIRLKPLGLDHADGYAVLLTDAVTAPYISEQGLVTRDAAIAKLQQITAHNVAGSVRAYFAIVSSISHEFLGYVAAHNLHAEVCSISYAVLPGHRQRGVAKAAIRLLLDYLSRHSTAEWVEAKSHPENIPSQATLRASGFTHVASAASQTGQRDVFRRKRCLPPSGDESTPER